MSTFDRFKRLAKSYLNEMSERLSEIDREAAERELDMNRAETKINKRLEQSRPADAPRVEPTGKAEQPDHASDIANAYRVLRVPEGADFALVRAAYYKAIRRADPAKFEADPEIKRQAEQIRRRVDDAYQTLRRELDPTAGRFRQLEIE